MPDTTVIVTGVGGGTEVIGRALIESGRLQGLAGHMAGLDTAPNLIWAEVGIEHGGVAGRTRVAILAQGYVSTNQTLTWDGDVQMEATSEVYLRIWSLLTTPVHLGILSTGAP